MASELSRRDLLKASMATAATLAVGPLAAAAPDSAPDPAVPLAPDPSRRLRVGIIGSGGKGASGMGDAAQFGDIVAICDVDANERSKALLAHPRAATFADYRQLLSAMKGGLDAVVISTPDHQHFLAAALAMKQGLHTYCEKPLTHTIAEARELGRLARVHRVATQMGNQSTASTPMRQLAKLIQNGEFGNIREIHLWTNRAAAYWQQGIPRPKPSTPPRTVDWDLWLGPAPERPFGDGYHPFAWRGWWDFGTGALGDMGCHIMNLPFMSLDLRDPVAVTARTSGHDRDSFPVSATVEYEFAARGDRPAVRVWWYDGGRKPDPKLAPTLTFGDNGVLMVFEKAIIHGRDEGNYNFVRADGQPIPSVPVDESPGHMAEFFRAAQGGPAAVSNFPNYASPLTETVLLGNLAIWEDGTRLEWDARNLRVKGKPELDRLIRPTYRKGWAP